jgi:hypothetical protein
MRKLFGLAIAGSLAACAAEEPPGVSAEKIEAAAEHAQLEVERAATPAPKQAEERLR